MAIVNEYNISDEQRKRDGFLEKPSRIEASKSMSEAARADAIKKSAIEDILQTVMTRDEAIKASGDVKNEFKRGL